MLLTTDLSVAAVRKDRALASLVPPVVAELLPVGLLWLGVGFLLGWRGGLGFSVAVPMLVAGIPLVVWFDGSFLVLPRGTDPLLFLQGVGVPVAAAFVGGNAAVAISPERTTRRRAQLAVQRAEDEVRRMDTELSELSRALREARPDRGDDPPIEISSPSDEDLRLLRFSVGSRRNRLRELRRTIDKSD